MRTSGRYRGVRVGRRPWLPALLLGTLAASALSACGAPDGELAGGSRVRGKADDPSCPAKAPEGSPRPELGDLAGKACDYACWGKGTLPNVCGTRRWQFCLPSGVFAECTPSEPFRFMGSFDGSQNFRMWTETMELARRVERSSGQKPHFTYFINGSYYYARICTRWDSKNRCVNVENFPKTADENGDGQPDVGIPPPRGQFGWGKNASEVLVRIALTQQAVNEGHEIGTHSMFHEDGGKWGYGQWNTDFKQMDALVGSTLFEPVRDKEGKALFPRWTSPATDDRALGAECDPSRKTDPTDLQTCSSGLCIPVADGKAYCSQLCNSSLPCPKGYGCGGPGWSGTFKDYCLPVPEFPVVVDGQTLFRADGTAEPAAVKAGLLKRYKMKGFRAPYLAVNGSTYQVMGDRGYLYDASQPRPVEAPGKIKASWQGPLRSLWEFGVMSARPAGVLNKNWPMPFDSVYSDFGLPAATMASQYKDSILRLYARRDEIPAWNIGAHFSYWETDRTGHSYWDVMQRTYEWAGAGCPDDATGAKGCPHIAFPSFADYVKELGAP
ncbi:MAG: hypothetical protein IT371_21375 [Deltaproteobacteria bacterium]|nr:hypothetical protein [Deltaproteobacteria bacterium]